MNRFTRDTVVTERVDIDFVGEDGCLSTLETNLVYDQGDPFAVSMVFETLPPVTWTFCRELLISGMYEPTGDGDVHIWPCLSTDGKAVVIFEFCSPDGELLVQADLKDCDRFVRRMLSCVPQGAEPSYNDIDAAILRLLGGTPDIQV